MRRLVFLFIIITSSAVGQILENAEEAFNLANATNKPVLLIFAGSDWCAPCIRLNDKVLSQEGFQNYAKEHFVTLKVDFPQRKKLSKEMRKQNDALAEKYNPNGQFPHLLLLRPDKTIIKLLTYKNQSSDDFIREIGPLLSE